jgi:hypothetical protein
MWPGVDAAGDIFGYNCDDAGTQSFIDSGGSGIGERIGP